MGRYNIDKGRLSKFEKLDKIKKERMSAKQLQEWSIMKAREEAAVLDIPKERLVKIRDYIRELKSLERATRSDLARLMVIEERINRM